MRVEELRLLLDSASSPPIDAEDYKIVCAIGATYLALAQSGVPALLVPLMAAPEGIGRRGGGFSLVPANNVIFNFHGRSWQQPAATLDCTDVELVDTFLALALDLATQIDTVGRDVHWHDVLTWLDGWQALLVRGAKLTVEQELGLWGELWVISKSAEPDLLLAAWRGPDEDPVDFFLDAVGIEVKVSRRPNVHHVSLTQSVRPVGDHEAYLLSLWVAPEPVRGTSLPELVEGLLLRIADPPAFLRRISALGYTPNDRTAYVAKYVVLETPLWFSAANIPQIRVLDPGISQLRYLVTLDPNLCCIEQVSQRLWDLLGHGTIGGEH